MADKLRMGISLQNQWPILFFLISLILFFLSVCTTASRSCLKDSNSSAWIFLGFISGLPEAPWVWESHQWLWVGIEGNSWTVQWKRPLRSALFTEIHNFDTQMNGKIITFWKPCFPPSPQACVPWVPGGKNSAWKLYTPLINGINTLIFALGSSNY